MNDQQNQNPFNAFPPVVVGLCIVIGGIELVLWLAGQGFVGGPSGVGWRLAMLQQFAFTGQVLNYLVQTGDLVPEHLMRFVTYQLVHVAPISAVFTCLFILALGKFAGNVFSGIALLALFFGSGIFGAFIYGSLVNTQTVLTGGMTGAYGLIGAYTYVMLIGAMVTGKPPISAFALVGYLLAFQLLFGTLFGGDLTWVAEISGFVAGFALCFIVRPGGLAALRNRLRR